MAALCLALPACLTASPQPSATALPPRSTATALPPPASPTLTMTAPASITAPPSQPPPTVTAPPLTYTVQPGDTLFAIALAHDVTVESLQAANGLEGDVIIPGQELIIPGGTVVPPTPITSPTPPSELTVVSFTASPNPVDRGRQVTLAWDVPFAVKVTLWSMTFDRKTGRWSRLEAGEAADAIGLPFTSTEAAGQWAGTVPADARYAYRFQLEAFDDRGARVLAESDVIDLHCYPPIAGGGYCPFAPITMDGVYQPYEHGHLVWRSDTGQILVISASPDFYLPWSLEQPTPRSRPIPAPPAGLYPPGWRFAGLWSSFDITVGTVGEATPELRTLALSELLGWPTAREQAYTLTLQIDLDNTQSGILNDHLYVTLPDGRIAALNLYNGAQGVTGPAWSFVEP